MYSPLSMKTSPMPPPPRSGGTVGNPPAPTLAMSKPPGDPPIATSPMSAPRSSPGTASPPPRPSMTPERMSPGDPAPSPRIPAPGGGDTAPGKSIPAAAFTSCEGEIPSARPFRPRSAGTSSLSPSRLFPLPMPGSIRGVHLTVAASQCCAALRLQGSTSCTSPSPGNWTLARRLPPTEASITMPSHHPSLTRASTRAPASSATDEPSTGGRGLTRSRAGSCAFRLGREGLCLGTPSAPAEIHSSRSLPLPSSTSKCLYLTRYFRSFARQSTTTPSNQLPLSPCSSWSTSTSVPLLKGAPAAPDLPGFDPFTTNFAPNALEPRSSPVMSQAHARARGVSASHQ
mmetsp:Transcript_60420/g.191906  ORF Transcript_60420/g.191906 Transcript_60420/m.191906 type:complete len:343 (+) Transcript_60420:115-1143(+)